MTCRFSYVAKCAGIAGLAGIVILSHFAQLTAQLTSSEADAKVNRAHVCFSPDGKDLIVTTDRFVERLEIGAGKPSQRIGEHRRPIHAVCFSPDGKMIATGDGDIEEERRMGEVKLWEAASGESRGRFLWPGSDVVSLSFSPDGAQLAGGGVSGFCVWDVKSSKELPGKELHSEKILGGALAVAFSPDGNSLAHGGFDTQVTLRDAKTWKKTYATELLKAEVRSVAFSPDGKLLASGGVKELNLWDAATGKRMNTLKHESTVWSVVFSPDSKLAITGSGDPSRTAEGELIVWDLANGKTVQRWNSTGGAIVSVALSPDGKSIAAGNYSGTVEMKKLDGPAEKPISDSAVQQGDR